MKNKANLVAVGTFLAGMAGFQFYASKLKAEIRGGKPEAALVITQDLKAGAILSAEHLGAAEIPSDYLDARRVRAKEKQHLVGVQITTALKAGEALLWSDIADGAAHKHLASLVTPGKRAYTINTDANPLGRLLRVADHVDVLLDSGGQSSLLLQQVLVLAVGGQIEREESPLGGKVVQGSGVTLSVTSEQARQLLAAEAKGRLRLVLRNPDDSSTEREEPKSERSASYRSSHKESTSLEIEHVR
jgi:pilus assembly protein CpaB